MNPYYAHAGITIYHGGKCAKCEAGIPRKFETNWYEGKWVHHDGNGWHMTLCAVQEDHAK
jgi:hypothetical protein